MYRSFLFSVLSSIILFASNSTSAQVPTNDSPIYPVNKTLSTVTIHDDFYGTRNVSYWVTSNNLAIIDGDVVYGTLQDLLDHTIKTPTTGISKAKRAFSAPNVWQAPIVIYKYDSDDTERRISSIVNEAIQRWNVGAPYIAFTATSPNGADHRDGVLTINATDCNGCQASIGFSASSGAMSMNLQQDCNKTGLHCGPDEATHEFGHVLG